MVTKKLPAYLNEYYGYIYGKEWVCKILDNFCLQNILTLGAHGKLIKSVTKEIKEGQKVLQFGITFGGQIEKTAEAVGLNGEYDIIDVSKGQIKRCKSKYGHIFPNITFFNQEATDGIDEKYDVVLCYMLLHEAPIVHKSKIINAVLNCVDDEGKAVFIDYHEPSSWHPLKYFIRMFNRLYQPFAEKLWDIQLDNYTAKKLQFRWSKTTYYAGAYQKVVAFAKKNPLDEWMFEKK